MRDETERLVKEALERKTLTVTRGKTRIESKCRKCGAPNRVLALKGRFGCRTRVRNAARNKGHSDESQPRMADVSNEKPVHVSVGA